MCMCHPCGGRAGVLMSELQQNFNIANAGNTMAQLFFTLYWIQITVLQLANSIQKQNFIELNSSG